MQELSFPLKIHVRRNGLRVLFVEHIHHGSYCPSPAERARQDQTRVFCDWIRKTFPSAPTEYRSTVESSCRYTRKKRHFVAYDLTPREFMMIKLAFGFTTIKVRFSEEKIWVKDYWSGRRRYRTTVPTEGYLSRYNMHPTAELLARMAKEPDKYRKLTRNRQN